MDPRHACAIAPVAEPAPALRALRPDTRTALFWHIPWPNPDRLRICPWRGEIVNGLLANDLIAFQVERDRLNFLMAAEEELGAEIEIEASRVRIEGHATTVVSVPIGVDFDRIQGFAADPALIDEPALIEALRQQSMASSTLPLPYSTLPRL